LYYCDFVVFFDVSAGDVLHVFDVFVPESVAVLQILLFWESWQQPYTAGKTPQEQCKKSS